MSAPVSRHFYEPIGPNRSQEWMDLLDLDGSIMQTIKVGSPAPTATVKEAVDRANREVNAS